MWFLDLFFGLTQHYFDFHFLAAENGYVDDVRAVIDSSAGQVLLGLRFTSAIDGNDKIAAYHDGNIAEVACSCRRAGRALGARPPVTARTINRP